MLSESGVREVTLLGQNVNSYADFSSDSGSSGMHGSNAAGFERPVDAFASHYAKGFRSVYRPNRTGAVSFAELLDEVAGVDPEMRIRFTSPHPKDFSDDVLDVIARRPNVCLQLHMPAQSGSTKVLQDMRRGYTREAYDELVQHVRDRLPGVALSTDMIAGFCGETENDHRASLELLASVRYQLAFLFAYSERERTAAWRHLRDDVPSETKIRRLQELIQVYREGLVEDGRREVGRRHLVLVEDAARRDPERCLTGRTDHFKRVVFENMDVLPSLTVMEDARNSAVVQKSTVSPGEYVAVQIIDGGGGSTLKGIPLAKTTIREFVDLYGTSVPLHTYDSIC